MCLPKLWSIFGFSIGLGCELVATFQSEDFMSRINRTLDNEFVFLTPPGSEKTTPKDHIA